MKKPWNRSIKGLQPWHNITGLKLGHGWNKGIKMPQTSGINHPMFGKKHTPETLEKNRLAHLGKIPANKKPPIFCICELCNKEFLKKNCTQGKFCSHKCYWESKIGENMGENSPFWKGGITKVHNIIRKSREYKIFVANLKKEDNYTCQLCGTKGGILHTDHYPKPFSQILKENNIQSLEDALNCPEMWNQNNLRTLCIDCHKQTDTYLKGWRTSKISIALFR